MINIKAFAFNPFQVNAYLLYDESRECLIIDASCYQEDEYQALFKFIALNSLKPVAVLNTHGHVDHLTGTRRICKMYSIDFFMNQDDQFLLENAVVSGQIFGMQVETPPQPAAWIKDEEIFKFGNSEIIAFHTPGHSPGSLVIYQKEAGILITGDVLFAGSIGRTDLPGGDYNQLIRSIQTKILVLPAETKVFPGHGPETTVGDEMVHNPFLNRSS
jgi:glyoxylase-like metal-dependent hydrolase (beta-lactamase superfamily II)